MRLSVVASLCSCQAKWRGVTSKYTSSVCVCVHADGEGYQLHIKQSSRHIYISDPCFFKALQKIANKAVYLQLPALLLGIGFLLKLMLCCTSRFWKEAKLPDCKGSK